VTIRDFRAGWNVTDLPVELTDNSVHETHFATTGRTFEEPSLVQNAQFPAMQNLIVSYLGRLQLRGGMHAVTTDVGSPPQGFARFFSPTLERLMVAADGAIQSFNEQDGTDSQVSFGGNPNNPIDFVSLYGEVYWADGENPPLKWDGNAPSAYQLGIIAPTEEPEGTGGGAGPLNSTNTGTSPYIYYLTFVSATGVESNPSPPSSGITVTNQVINVISIAISDDPQVTQRNLYRVGGANTEIRLVTTINDNTSSIYTDSTADTNVPLTQAVFNHDIVDPSVGFFFAHKNRLWGAGSSTFPYRLWFSSYGQPDYFPLSTVDPVNDGGFLDIDPDFSDPIIALAPLGSLLLIARRRTMYICEGDTVDAENPFTFRKVADFGCIAHRSLVLCRNSALFLGVDGLVYQVTDDQPTPLSLPLESLLKSVDPLDLAGACAAYGDQRYYLFIPGADASTAPVNIVYDFRTSSWTDFSDPHLGATALYSQPGGGNIPELLFATKAGYTQPDGSSYNGIMSALNSSDVNPTTVHWKSPDFELGRPTWTKRAKNLRMEGILAIPDPVDGGGATVTVRAYTPGRTDISHTYALTPRDDPGGFWFDSELSADLVGRRLSLEINGYVTAFEFQTVDFSYAYIREKS
jgi:hypothetical protein